MGRISTKTQIDTGDISSDDILLITDLSDASDDKKITMGQIATFSATDISGKQDLITTPTNNNVVTTDALGQTKDSGIASSSLTTQGNTFNGNSQLVQLNSSGQYPALDGSLITNLAGGGVVVFDNKGTVATNITLAENKITTGYWSGSNTITLP